MRFGECDWCHKTAMVNKMTAPKRFKDGTFSMTGEACAECFDRFGPVPNHIGLCAVGGPRSQDIGPSWDNTVRALEEDR